MSGKAGGATVGKAGLLVGVLSLGALGVSGCGEPPKRVEPPPPTVGVVEARRMTVPLISTSTGTTRSLQDVAIRARVRGFLDEQHFQDGSFVKEGQLLFLIHEEPFQVALKSAQAKRDEAKASLQKAQASKAPEVAAAQIAVDKAQLAYYRVEESRQRALIQRNAASAQELDQTIAQRQRFEAQVEADQANHEQAKADYDVNILAAQARLDEAEASVRNAELDLSYCRIIAPFSGRIGEARVKVGNLVGPTAPGGADNTELATIQRLDPMGVDIRVSSNDLSQMARLIREKVGVTMVRPRGESGREQVLEGRLIFYDNTIEPTSSTFLARAEFPNPDATMLPGEYVKLQMTVDTLRNTVVVPEEAVTETQAGPVVNLVGDDGTVVVQKVNAGRAYQGSRIIHDGLEAGQKVIVEGLQLVRPGIPVKAEPAKLPQPVHKEGTEATPVPEKAQPGNAAPAAKADPGAEGEKPAESAETPKP